MGWAVNVRREGRWRGNGYWMERRPEEQRKGFGWVSPGLNGISRILRTAAAVEVERWW